MFNIFRYLSTFTFRTGKNMIVEVKQGRLQGAVRKSVLTDKEYYSFLGIPYAIPPINELRFQAPIPLEKWDGILDASKEGMPCTQLNLESRILMGSEDCLYLNVHVPKPTAESSSLKPVMVFIHGGGFASGSGSIESHAPDYLINYDVVFVSLNYRLHALGFLNMGTKSISPNCGLRDQALALKWIKENIREFGGDSENITIFGESAGASSVHFQMVSPLSRGSFHKAILQSGTFNCSWSVAEEPVKSGFLLARKLGFNEDTEDPEKIIEFLKTQRAEKIALAVEALHVDSKRETPGKNISLCFLPSVEMHRENAFIPDHPHELMKNADPVPLIVGLNDKEGRLAFIAMADNLIETLQQDFTNILKHDLKCDKERIAVICKKVKEFYFGEKQLGPETVDAIVDLYTDMFFRNFYESFENITNSKCPVYVYEFGFHGKFNIYTRIMMNDPTISSGAAHADEMPYIFFSPKHQKAEFDEPELTLIKTMCSMWSNFARTGNPTQDMKIEWRPSTSEKPCYLRIENELKLVEGKVMSERIEFWKHLNALALS